MTTRQQFQLIRKVLYDIECAEISFLERTTEPAYSFSLTYLTAMQQLCAREKKRERLPLYGMKRSTVFAIIIAALLALLTLTACIFHNKITDYYITITKHATYFETESANPEGESKEYEMCWVPEGYTIKEKKDLIIKKITIWEKDGKEIGFTQSLGSAAQMSGLNTENEPIKTGIIEDKTVYYIEKNGYVLIWKEGNGSFMLACPPGISWDDVERMIRSVRPFEP